MFKKVLIGIIIGSFILSAIFYCQYYYDTYIDKDETIITGINSNITSLASKNISNEIVVTNGQNRDLLLKQYDTKTKKWKTTKTYKLNNKPKQNIKIEYPNNWKKTNSTKWKIEIKEGKTVLPYQSKKIDINTTNRQELSLEAKSAIIMEYETGQIYYQKDIDKKRSIASTTKIMTCLVAIENSNLNDKVRISSEAVTTHLSRLRGVGDQVKLKDLLYDAMLSSDNGAAVAIAQHTGKTLKGFSKMVNKRIQEIELKNTRFTNPAGFTADYHYSTAKDLATFTRVAYSNKTLRKIVKTASYSFTTLRKHNSYQCNNTNKLLKEIPGVTGMKTGTTYAAGKCFVCTYTHNKKTYITVVLGSSENGRWNDTKKLINYINRYC